MDRRTSRGMDRKTSRGRNRQKDTLGCCLYRNTPTRHWVALEGKTMPAERWTNRQAEKGTDRRTNRRRKEQTETDTPGCCFVAVFPQDTHTGYIQACRRKDNANRATENQTDRERGRQNDRQTEVETDRGRNRQKDTPRCCLNRSWYSH